MDREEVMRIIEQDEGLNTENSKGGEPELLEGDIFRIIIPLAPEEEAGIEESAADDSERWSEKGIFERQRQILELLHENPGISRKEISEIRGISQSAVRKHMDTLRKKGIIRRVCPARGGHWEVVK